MTLEGSRPLQGDRARRAQGVATLASGEYAAYRAASSGHSADTLEPLIDVRPHASFIERHVRWATSIPIDELRARMFELPPPYESSVSLFGNSADMQAAAALLEQYGWTVHNRFDCDSPDSFHAASGGDADEVVVSGKMSRPVWRPSDFLEEVLLLPEVQAWAAEDGGGGVRHALDVGCGAGRDMALMARLLGPNWKVKGIDNDQGALQRARLLAQREGVSAQVDFVDMNLRKEKLRAEAELVHGCRYFVLCRLVTASCVTQPPARSQT